MRLADCPTSVRHAWNPPPDNDLPRPSRRPSADSRHRPRRKVSPRPITPLQQRVLDAIGRGPHSGPMIAAALGIAQKLALQVAGALFRRGLVRVDRGVRPMVFTAEP